MRNRNLGQLRPIEATGARDSVPLGRVAILGLLGAKLAMQAVALGGGFIRMGGNVVDAAMVAAATT